MTSDEERTAQSESEVEPEGRVPHSFVVWVSGDLDLDHSAELRSLLLDGVARAPRGTEIIVDLQNSSFCDSTGLNLLLAAREMALGSGKSITLAAPSHQMVRLLEITGSSDLFDFGPAEQRWPR
ncbi:STAS domain-containing protein [Streptomyces vietnamensis]|uniref:STAS domain-containing protein n=1 Tax=Streptomyces vietnamensis TaxID=362257 RepID=UPI00069653B5|nr:STAS domain-containing protein [Streptomyces vietnamensis]